MSPNPASAAHDSAPSAAPASTGQGPIARLFRPGVMPAPAAQRGSTGTTHTTGAPGTIPAPAARRWAAECPAASTATQTVRAATRSP